MCVALGVWVFQGLPRFSRLRLRFYGVRHTGLRVIGICPFRAPFIIRQARRAILGTPKRILTWRTAPYRSQMIASMIL